MKKYLFLLFILGVLFIPTNSNAAEIYRAITGMNFTANCDNSNCGVFGGSYNAPASSTIIIGLGGATLTDVNYNSCSNNSFNNGSFRPYPFFQLVDASNNQVLATSSAGGGGCELVHWAFIASTTLPTSFYFKYIVHTINGNPDDTQYQAQTHVSFSDFSLNGNLSATSTPTSTITLTTPANGSTIPDPHSWIVFTPNSSSTLTNTAGHAGDYDACIRLADNAADLHANGNTGRNVLTECGGIGLYNNNSNDFIKFVRISTGIYWTLDKRERLDAKTWFAMPYLSNNDTGERLYGNDSTFTINNNATFTATISDNLAQQYNPLSAIEYKTIPPTFITSTTSLVPASEFCNSKTERSLLSLSDWGCAFKDLFHQIGDTSRDVAVGTFKIAQKVFPLSFFKHVSDDLAAAQNASTSVEDIIIVSTSSKIFGGRTFAILTSSTISGVASRAGGNWREFADNVMYVITFLIIAAQTFVVINHLRKEASGRVST